MQTTLNEKIVYSSRKNSYNKTLEVLDYAPCEVCPDTIGISNCEPSTCQKLSNWLMDQK
jgi:hypothetical protein